MNWMTSGRRRVQRSQKGRELRAKHFAKVAADRARAPVSQPTRAVRSPNTRQSTDISRLKSRWTQQPLGIHEERPPAQADSICPPSDVTSLRPGTTPDASPFQPGTLELEVTPPFGGPRPYDGDDGNGVVGGLARRGSGATASGISSFSGGGGGARPNGAGHEVFEVPCQDPRRSQQRLPHLTSTLPPAELEASSPKRARPPLGRRQLVFGGSASTAEQREFGEDYEGQLLGSDTAGLGGSPPGQGQAAVQSKRNGLVLGSGTFDAAAAGFSATRAVDQQGRLCNQWGSSMRFFNAGVEVALDGSPVLDNAASSPPTPSLSASSCARRLAIPGNVPDTAGVLSGLRGAGEMRGMPKFSIGGGKALGLDSRTVATPPGSWEETLPGDADMNEISVCRLQRSASSHAGPEGRMPERFQPAPLTSLEEGIQQASPYREKLDASGGENVLAEQDSSNPHGSPPTAAAAGFEVLAQAWGLFGGALAASPAQRGTHAFAASACPGSNSEGDASVEAARNSAVKEISGGHGFRDDDGGAGGGVPRLDASVLARYTPPMASPAEYRTQATKESNVCEPSPAISGPPPSSDKHDHRIDLDDGSSSPELTMMFVEEPGQGQSMGVSARQAEDESSEGEPHILYGQPTEPGRLATDGAQGSTGTAPGKAPQRRAADLHANDDQEQVVRSDDGDHETFNTKERPSSVSKRHSSDMIKDITQENDPDACREQAVECVPELRPSKPLVGSGAASITSPVRELQSPQEGCRGNGDHGGGSRRSRLPRPSPPTDAGDGTMAAGNAELSATSSHMSGNISVSEIGRRAGPAALTAISDARFPSSAVCPRAPSASTRSLVLPPFTDGTAPSPVRDESRKRTRQGGGMQEARDGQCEPGESAETTGGEAGVRESRKALRRKSIVSAALLDGRSGSSSTCDDDGGDAGGDGSGKSRKQRKIHTRFNTERADARSTIVWYRTIVACLTS